MKPKKIPQRMCIVCRALLPKTELIRIVRNTQGEFIVDKTGKETGRGCYVCNNSNCQEKCIKARLLNRAYKTEVSNEVYEKLNAEFTKKD